MPSDSSSASCFLANGRSSTWASSAMEFRVSMALDSNSDFSRSSGVNIGWDAAASDSGGEGGLANYFNQHERIKIRRSLTRQKMEMRLRVQGVRF